MSEVKVEVVEANKKALGSTDQNEPPRVMERPLADQAIDDEREAIERMPKDTPESTAMPPNFASSPEDGTASSGEDENGPLADATDAGKSHIC